MSRIVVAGSINMDIVARTDTHPRPGETVMGRDLHFIPGGKGANQAVAASRLGGAVNFLGKVGQDPFGDSLLNFLRGEKLDLTAVGVSADAPTGTALIVVDNESENAIVVVPGSNSEVSLVDVGNVPLAPDDLILSQFEIPTEIILALFERARSIGARTILNPAPAAACAPRLLELSDYLVVNETELAFFARAKDVPDNQDDLFSLAEELASTTQGVVIVTVGHKGVMASRNGKIVSVSGHEVRAVDTTGAGDCFVGAFAVGLTEGSDLQDCLRFANAAAAVSVQHLGASSSLPSRSEVDSFLARV